MDLVTSFFSGNKDAPRNATDRFLAAILCKTLNELCETSQAILKEMQGTVDPRRFPSRGDIDMCRVMLSKMYSEDLFIDDDGESLPNWAVLKAATDDGAYKIYACIKRNITDDIEAAFEDRDTDFFVAHFDDIFESVPLKDSLTKFKEFIVSKHMTDDRRDIIWDYFDLLMDILLHGNDFVNSLDE